MGRLYICTWNLFVLYFGGLTPKTRVIWVPGIHEWLIFMVHVDKYTIHGSYGL